MSSSWMLAAEPQLVYKANVKENNKPPKLARINKKLTTSLQIWLGITSHKPQHTSLHVFMPSCLHIFKSSSLQTSSSSNLELLEAQRNSNPSCELKIDATGGLNVQILIVIALWKAIITS